MFDRQVARLDPVIAGVAREFVLARQTRMREIDLDLFEFDYDLTWMGFFLDPEGRVLGRYGGRDAESPDSRLSLAGLKYAMGRALERHRARKPGPPAAPSRPRTVEDFSAAKALPTRACVHCHQVYDLRRESLLAEGKWRKEELWVYPPPENIGFSLSVDQGDVVTRVTPGSIADSSGMRKGDRLLTLNDRPVTSFADAQHALHRAPGQGKVNVAWLRDGREYQAALVLADGWRKTDISWRWSLRGVDPPPWVQGPDLSANEKKSLGLPLDRLALEQGQFLSLPARQAGIRQGDVVVGIDGKEPTMTARQFGAYVRLNYNVGDRVVYQVLRDGKRIDVPLTLRGRR
ncbi:MAG: Trx7/PDZ domain-containing (seleno)protein [Gemmataceae bacterium]